MYKCGWNNCEKAYGTLNHLNAHVTMQSHGAKRTPEGKLSSVAPRSLALHGLCLSRVQSVAIPSGCRKWLDRVSAGICALVSYTRFRGAAVAWPPAWRLSLVACLLSLSAPLDPHPPHPKPPSHLLCWTSTLTVPAQNSRRSERNGRPGRRRKRLSARLPRSVSVLRRRRRRPTRWKLLVPPIHPRDSHLPTPVVFALSFLPSATSPLMARSPVSMVLPAVVWSTRATDRWVTLPTTLTRLTRTAPSTSNVSKKKQTTTAILFLCQDRLQTGVPPLRSINSAFIPGPVG